MHALCHKGLYAVCLIHAVKCSISPFQYFPASTASKELFYKPSANDWLYYIGKGVGLYLSLDVEINLKKLGYTVRDISL